MNIDKYDYKIKPNLNRIPETALWTLYNRASEAKRNDSIIKDTMAIEVLNKIDFAYKLNFGKPEPSHAIRSAIFDSLVLNWIKDKKDGTIISLGEGLETQFFRLNNEKLFWNSIDLKEIIEIRNKLLPKHKNLNHLTYSALDERWLKHFDPQRDVLIIAQGLLMYFEPKEVISLVKCIMEYFSNVTLLFDTIPKWMVHKTKKGWRKTKFYKVPEMPWGVNQNEINQIFQDSLKYKMTITIHQYRFPRGFIKLLFNLMIGFRFIRNRMNAIVELKNN